MMWRNVRRAMAQLADGVAAIVVTSPDPVMPMFRRSRAAKIYYATDDFVAGADLFGYSADFARRARTANTRHSDLTLAVSEQLGGIMSRTARRVAVLPNGCDSAAFDRVPGLKRSPDVTLPSPVAGVVGQLNDRLDLDLLEAVGRTGDSLLLIGPRYEESAEATSRLDGLIARPNVQWMDRQPFDRLPELFASIDVGLTPYLDNEFNRSSFPLKTLEYLAAGRPVVTTDLPSVRSLDLELVTCARGADAFAAAVHLALRAPDRADLVPRRQAFARMHRWDARANELNEILKDIARISENRRDN
jgi:teichuronic acid biosynthesis glycosyltransferase TuaH